MHPNVKMLRQQRWFYANDSQPEDHRILKLHKGLTNNLRTGFKFLNKLICKMYQFSEAYNYPVL